MKVQAMYNSNAFRKDMKVILDGKVASPKRAQLLLKTNFDFDWGCRSIGSLVFALTMLLEAGVAEEEALILTPPCRDKFISTIQRDTFSRDIDVLAWVGEANPLVLKGLQESPVRMH